MQTGREAHTLERIKGAFSVAFSPDGQRLAAGGVDWKVRIWDATTGQLVLTFRGHNREVSEVAFSPNGKRVASVGADMVVRVWDAANAVEQLVFKCSRGDTKMGAISGVAFSPDGKRLASSGGDKTVRIWEVTD